MTFPNVKNDTGASTKAQNSPCFFFFLKASPANPFLANPFLAKISVLVVSQFVRPRRVGGPEGWAPKGGEPNILRLFFPLPHHFRSFCLPLGVFSWNFGGFCEAPGESNVHVFALGLSCEAPAASGPPELHTTI